MKPTMKSITFLCDEKIIKAIQDAADKNYEGKFSPQLRQILRDWNESAN